MIYLQNTGHGCEGGVFPLAKLRQKTLPPISLSRAKGKLVASKARGRPPSMRRPPLNYGTAASVMGVEWDRPYSRELGVFPLATLKQVKYWTPIGRIDNVYGDRNLFCICVPVSEYA